MIDERFYVPLKALPLSQLLSEISVDLDSQFQDVIVETPETLGLSKPGQICFLQAKKYSGDLGTARATACFVSAENAALVGNASIIPIISASPRAHFSRVIDRLVQKKELSDDGEMDLGSFCNSIHPTAVIASNAIIGVNVRIDPFVVIGPGVEIGENCKIGAHAVIECAIIGNDCNIKSHATIGTRGFGVDGDENGIFDLPHIGRVLIHDRVSVGAHSCIDRGFIDDTVIGNDVKIDNMVQIAHNVTIGEGSMMAAHVGVSGSCHVGKNVVIGGAVGVADHINIGDGVRIAARAGVMNNIPDGEMWSGVPAMPIREHMRIIAVSKKLIQKKK